MLKKIIVFSLTLLISLSAIIINSNDFEVEATGGGGSGSNNNGFLNNSYIWEKLQEICNVVYDAYEENDIIKGRAFGTKGARYTVNYILNSSMNIIGLDDVQNLSIGYISSEYSDREYSSKMITKDYQLIINNASDKPYNWSQYVPKNESFPIPAGRECYQVLPLNQRLTRNYTFENELVRKYKDIFNCPVNYPFAGTLTNYFYNITITESTDNSLMIGNVTYLTTEEELPEDQEGQVFMIEDEEGSQNKLDNMTNNSGCIVISEASRGYQNVNISKCIFPIIKVQNNTVNQNNFTNISNLLNSGEWMIVDNVVDNNTLTFTYNISEACLPANDNWVFIDEKPPAMWDGWGNTKFIAEIFWQYNFHVLERDLIRPICKGIILYDFLDNTHFMAPTSRGWQWSKGLITAGYGTGPALPIFSINHSVGSWLISNRYTDTTISGYLDQEWKQQTSSSPGIIDYNVVGYRNISNNPGDKTVILSNRFDGFWGETPGDSGVGGAILLGIAKYMTDYDITPKCNITFLFTTGEEYGMRGAFHFRDSHPENDHCNYTLFLTLDQLAMNYSNDPYNLTLLLAHNSTTYSNILDEIIDITEYHDRTGYKQNVVKGGKYGGTDAAAFQQGDWKNKMDIIAIHKSQSEKDGAYWYGYHRAGINFTEGDTLKNIDRNDVNITAELAWNISRYFCVNPDSWLTNIQYEPIDSPNDGDTLIDSIRANFTINTILPHDNVMIEVLYDIFWETGGTTNIHYAYENFTVNSSGRDESLIFTIPYGDSQGDYAMKIRLYNSTGRINEMVGIGNNNYNDSSGSSTYNLSHPFGYPWKGEFYENTDNRISGSVFTTNEKAYVENITAYVYSETQIPAYKSKCMIYRKNDSKLIGTTDELSFGTAYGGEWKSYPFSNPKPSLTEDTEYVLVLWSDGVQLYYDNYTTSSSGRYNLTIYGESPPDPIDCTNENRIYSIYCCYLADNTPPEINNITSTPEPVGFGMSENIYADVTDTQSGVNTVKVNITCPNMTTFSYTMTNIQDDTYKYIFNNTWKKGQYNYHIWTLDNNNNSNTSDTYSFNVSGQANITVCTIKDSYSSNETINLTDPPGNDPPLIGYELLDNDEILHIWNQYNDYYFNTSNGVQFTNHYNEYWTHNVLMLGYYNNNQWNLLYRTDELGGFNKNINTDNTTYMNATIWKDLTYGGYDFRLAIRYHLGVDDEDLTIIPYIKNIDDEDIPYNLGFGWEIKDIQIANVEPDNYLKIFNGTSWENLLLSQTLDKTYTDIDHNTTIRLICANPPTYHLSRDLYLSWDENLNYKVTCKSRIGQYNAPVTLFIKIGTLDTNQEKYTQIYWLDSDNWLGINGYNRDSECGYDHISHSFEAALNGTSMWAHGVRETHWGIVDLGQTYTIKKVRGRSNFLDDPIDVDIYVSDNKSNWGTAVITGISTWQDTSNWLEIDTTDKDGRYIKIEIIDTEGLSGPQFLSFGDDMSPFQIFDAYGDIPYYNNAPEVSNLNPPDNSTGVPTTPMLNITVSDADGDTMNITWLSNSSGSWQVFATNNNLNNGTYYQNMTNASINAQWWYWKVNVTDGINYTESNVFSFYTGCESKIVNTGSTSIKGYLLIQVQFYNNSSWVVADDTINETSPRIIPWADPGGTPGQNILALDSIFNGLVNTNELSGYGNGTYRIYAALRDPDGNALICDDNSEMIAVHEFTVTF